MPRPDWRHMPASAWYGPQEPRQDALFAQPDTGQDDFGTLPFEGCTVEDLSPPKPKDACG